MAIAFDAATDGGLVVPGTSLTWSHTCSGSDRLLRVGVRSTQSITDNVTGVTYNGVALTLIGRVNGGGGFEPRTVSLWELVNPASGAHDVVVSGTSDVIMGESASYTGVGAGHDHFNTAQTGAGSSLSVSVTPVADQCWIQGVFGNDVGDPSAGTGATERVSAGNGIGLYDNNAAISPAASTSMTATTGGSGFLVWVAASIVPTSVSGSPWYAFAQQ